MTPNWAGAIKVLLEELASDKERVARFEREAKLLASLNHMRDVVSVGQGFADEVFRVFATAHPRIVIRTFNTSTAVEAMIQHVKRSSGIA